jgi:hypothetical protein
MKDAIKKMLGIAPQEKEMKETPIVTEATVVDNTAELTALQAQVAEQTAQLEKLTALLADANAVIATSMEAAAKAEAEAHAVKMEARKATIVENIGTAKAEAFLLATEALDDTAFAAVASALAGSVEFEANTTLFKEVGVDASATAETLPVSKSATMKILEAKYKQGSAT